jgi:hypothetical protein
VTRVPDKKGRRIVLAGAVVVAVLAVSAGTVAAVRLTGGDQPRSAAAGSTTATAGASPTGGAQAGTAPSAQVDGQDGIKSPVPSASGPAGPPALGGDEFDDGAVDTAKWAIYTSTAPNGSAMTTGNVKVADGELQVVGIGNAASGKGNTSGGLCWCAGGGNRTFGIWKVRARFDAGVGYSPAIGLWPESDKASDGSINLVRIIDGDRKTMHASVNTPPGYARTAKGDFTTWHTYTVEWRATFVKVHIDDQLMYDSAASTTPVVIPKLPMHLYVQLMAGPSSDVPAPGASTPAQVVMHVDWVRMYS